jgi:small subunit ribosomal protein S5
MNPNHNNQNQRQQRPGGGPNFRPGGPRFNSRPPMPSDYFEKVVQVNRVSKKNAGGDKRSLSVIVVVGDKKGKVGVGLGKAGDVQSAVRKATTAAKKNMITVLLKEDRTIPHDVFVKLGAAKVILKSAPAGTGIIAGGPVRVVVEACGIKDIVSKTLGTKNKASNVYVALEALKRLKVVTKKEEVKKEATKKEIKEK